MTNNWYGYTPGLQQSSLVNGTPKNLKCEDGKSFKEYIALGDLVKSNYKEKICDSKSGHSKNVKIYFQMNEKSETAEDDDNDELYLLDNQEIKMNSISPTVAIVVTAILSIILTLSIVGIVLRVLRYDTKKI